MKKPKTAHTANPKKSSGDSHVSHTNMGMGDYYGTGIKAKVGKVIEGVGMKPLSNKKLGVPPKSVV